MRDWWLRALLVLQRPRPVFVALRDDSKESVSDRAEPVLAIVLLAGIAALLPTTHSRDVPGRRFRRRADPRGLGLSRRQPVRRIRVLRHRRAALRRFEGAGLAGQLPPFAPRGRLRRRADRALARPLADQAGALRRIPLSHRRQRPRHRPARLRRAGARVPALVGGTARDRRARGARLDVGARRLLPAHSRSSCRQC